MSRGDEGQLSYIERIAELEAEVMVLKVELAHWKALALAGENANIEAASKPGSLGRSPLERVPPTHVNADGTQGMRRGVSGREPTSARDADEGT